MPRELSIARPVAVNRPVVTDDRASLRFDGTSSYVNTGGLSGLSANTEKTISVLMKPSAITNNEYIMSVGTPGIGMLVSLFTVNNGFLKATIYGADVSTTKPHQNISVWKEVVFVIRTTVLELYVNGVLAGTANHSTAINTELTEFSLGKNSGGTYDYWGGNIKEARVWNRALSATEILQMAITRVAPRTSLVAEYLLNEGAGATAYDTSGNGNNGTITGATWSTDTPSKARTLSVDRPLSV